jgi:hypothetical protein
MTARELTSRHRGEAEELAAGQRAELAALDERHKAARIELARRHERELADCWRSERTERGR